MARKPKETSRKKRRPSFFKIMCGDFQNTLKLPLAFTMRFEAELKTKSILKDPTVTWWYVKAKKIEGHFVFKNNWPSFAESNSLQYGDVLIFTYVGDSTFTVKIYDRTQCEKVFTSAKKKKRSMESASVAVNAQNTCNRMGDSGKSTIGSGGKRYPLNDRKQSCQLSKFDQTKRPSMEIPRQCGSPAASEKITDLTTKSRPFNVELSTDICLERSKPVLRRSSLRKPKRLLKHREAAEIYQSDIELIVVDSESESEEKINNLEASVSSSKDIEFHGFEVECGNESQDELDSPILDEESSCLPIVKGGSHPKLSAKRRRHAITQERAENQSYEVPLSHSYIYKGYLQVPIKLRRCLTEAPVGKSINESENVRLWISDDRSWSLQFSFGRNKAYFRRGWSEFVADNNLVEGEVCIFQLMKTGKIDLRVSVRRVCE